MDIEGKMREKGEGDEVWSKGAVEQRMLGEV